VTEIVDSVSIEYYHLVVRNVLYQQGQELLHVTITAQPRTDDPAVNSLLPPLQLRSPLLSH
jgi:hypothetical protein